MELVELKMDFTTPLKSHQIAECATRDILSKARILLFHSGLSIEYWPEVQERCTYLELRSKISE